MSGRSFARRDFAPQGPGLGEHLRSDPPCLFKGWAQDVAAMPRVCGYDQAVSVARPNSEGGDTADRRPIPAKSHSKDRDGMHTSASQPSPFLNSIDSSAAEAIHWATSTK